MSDRSPSTDDRATDDRGRVIRFRPRGIGPSGWRWPVRRPPPADTPVEDLSKFEHTDTEDDYRHRMRMNALAFVATMLLIAAGVWLAVSIAEMVKNQDCFLQGRRNCNPPVLTAPER